MTLGDKIKMLRTSNQLSQESLAALLDISRQSVSKWEQGISNPSSEKLIRLSEIFKVSIQDLLDENVQMQKHFNTFHYFRDIFQKKGIYIPISICLIVCITTYMTSIYLESIKFDKQPISILVSISGGFCLIAYLIFLSTILRYVYIDCKLRAINPLRYVLISATVVGLAFYLLRRDEISKYD